jgi:hypothetical protein
VSTDSSCHDIVTSVSDDVRVFIETLPFQLPDCSFMQADRLATVHDKEYWTQTDGIPPFDKPQLTGG